MGTELVFCSSNSLQKKKMNFSIKDFFSKCDQIRSLCSVLAWSSWYSLTIFLLSYYSSCEVITSHFTLLSIQILLSNSLILEAATRKFVQPIAVRCWLSIPRENIRKRKGFLMFSEGIEKQHPAVMGESYPFKLPHLELLWNILICQLKYP